MGQVILLLSRDRVFFEYLAVLLDGKAEVALSSGEGKLPPCDLCILDLDTVAEQEAPDVRTVTVGHGEDASLRRPFSDAELLSALFLEEAGEVPLLHAGSRRVSFGGKTVSLTAQEYRLFEMLLSADGKELSKEELLCGWEGGTLDLLRVYMFRLRKKLEGTGMTLRSRHRGGYLLIY
jgi:DNA-binding response OmpR family regulator